MPSNRAATSEDLHARKAALRREVRAWRAALSDAAIAQASAAITARLLASAAWRDAEVVFVFASLPREVDTTPLRAASGKRIVLPRVEGRGLPLGLYDAASAPLVAGAMGVREPGPRAVAVSPEAIDLVIVPALAVDHAGRRLGYGGGYYDRTLPLCVNARRVAVALAAQVRGAVPAGPTDAPIDAIVTEEGWIDCPPR